MINKSPLTDMISNKLIIILLNFFIYWLDRSMCLHKGIFCSCVESKFIYRSTNRAINIHKKDMVEREIIVFTKYRTAANPHEYGNDISALKIRICACVVIQAVDDR